LVQKLEIRLDNILYRINWVPTLPTARQIVNHGHIWVGQQRVTIPSFSCLPGQVIKVIDVLEIRKLVEKSLQERTLAFPVHLSVDSNKLTGVVESNTDCSDSPSKLNELLVVEYYSNRILIAKFLSTHFLVSSLDLPWTKKPILWS
jgi:small subunit ribosomal protein S4